MNRFFPTPTVIVLSLFVLIFSISCSKDSDLLADYVISDALGQNAGILRNFVVDDAFETLSNSSIVIDVLSNDSLVASDNVKIVQTSIPKNGSVVINEDYTITYTNKAPLADAPQDTTAPIAQQEPSSAQVPVPETDDAGTPAPENTAPTTEATTNSETAPTETSTDTFTYTAEVVSEDGSVTTDEGSVVVNVKQQAPPVAPQNVGDSKSRNYGELKAFPSAEGFGRYATGGRGGRIVEVTNLNDSGSGSLRAALKMTGARTIVFRVGGTINCNSYLEIPENSGNLTIAGQTAPGDGITIRGAELRIQASNIIARYLRIRPGHNTSGSNEDGVRIIAYSGNRTEKVILDHCSITWGKDENMEIGGIGSGSNVRNVTVQNCIIGENVKTKYGLLLWNDAKNISVYRNLFAHNQERNIRSSTCTSTFEMVNNVVYGYSAGTYPTYENKFNVVGNVYITNPNLGTYGSTINLEASTNNCPNGNIGQTEAFISDNILNGGQISISSNLNGYMQGSDVMNSAIVPMQVNEVQNSVFSDVGVSLVRDAVDDRIIDEVKNRRNGSASVQYPNISGGSSYADADRDGMADSWETSVGLNPNNADDAKADRNGDGYTNLEDYLNEVDF